jgi:peptidoglycan/LPS O-acetylase OafA/YrhL
MTPLDHTLPGPTRSVLRPAPPPKLSGRRRYLLLLGWAFGFFSVARVLSYLPAILAIWQQGESTQHSVITWATLMSANLTMAAWLYEHNGRRANGAVWANLANTVMCSGMLLTIVLFR